jgi:hypothetical protein
MDMVGHEHIGVYLAPVAHSRLTQAIEVAVIILLRKQRRLPVVAALDEVKRNIR